MFVLSNKGEYFSYFGYEDLAEKIKISYLKNWMGLKKEKKLNKGLSNIITYRSKRLLKDVSKFFIIPDQTVWMGRDYYHEAKSIIEKHQIENVIVSSPPHGIQRVGNKLKKKLKDKINLFVDYRDSWNNSTTFLDKNIFRRFISKKIEKEVLKNTDNFLYVSGPILDKIKENFKLDIKDKSKLIMNGFVKHPMIPNEIGVEKSKIQIGHFGAISDEKKSFRNVSYLLNVLKDNLSLCSKMDFHFCGKNKIKSIDPKIQNSVFLHNSVSHIKAISKMRQMDFLLLVHTDKEDSDEIFTGKIFDYIFAGIPIICFSPENMEARRLISNLEIGIWINYDNPDEIKQKLELLMQNYDSYIEAYKKINLDDFNRENQ